MLHFLVVFLYVYSGRPTLIRLKNPSADRNCEPILSCLHKVLDKSEYGLKLLEIASGTGQHTGHFAPAFPNILFHPSEVEPAMFNSIRAFTEPYKNVSMPMSIDIRQPYGKWNWPIANLSPSNVSGTFDYILNINMIHISPWECTEGTVEALFWRFSSIS